MVDSALYLYIILLTKTVKNFRFADLVIASVEIIYLSVLFFYALFFSTFKPEYGDNETANTIGIGVGIFSAILGIVILRRNWIVSKKK